MYRSTNMLFFFFDRLETYQRLGSFRCYIYSTLDYGEWPRCLAARPKFFQIAKTQHPLSLNLDTYLPVLLTPQIWIPRHI
jgi:hypothetical protein